GDLAQEGPGTVQAGGDVVGAVQVRVVDQALPADGGARLLEVGAHHQQQVILQLVPERGETAGVVDPGGGVVDRAGADDDQQPVVAAVQHGTHLLAMRGDPVGGIGGQRELGEQLARGGQRGVARDVAVGCDGGGGGESAHGSCPSVRGGPDAQ